MLEALRIGGYNTKGLIGLGAATLDVEKEVFSVLDLLAEAVVKIENKATDGLDWVLTQTVGRLPLFGNILAGIGKTVTAFADEIVDLVANGLVGNALDKIQEMVSPYLREIPLLGSMGLTGMPVEFVVNVWGEDDILNKLKIGGYRAEIGGFISGDQRKPLFNIEIKNGLLPDQKADHFAYQRYPSATAWDKKVSDFVAQLTVASRGSGDEIRDFLARRVALGLISVDERGVYVLDGSLL